MENRNRQAKTRTRTARPERRYLLQFDPTKLTPEAHKAIVECLKIAARRGRELRLARERRQSVASAKATEEKDVNDQPLTEESQSQEKNHAG